jgi:hypothetical protein
MRTTRAFGIEIEVSKNAKNVTKKEAKKYGFKKVEDTSIQLDRDHGGGYFYGDLKDSPSAEFISKICKGNNDLKTIASFVDVLNVHGCDMNDSCGLHIHINVKDYAPESIIDLVKNVAYWDAVLWTFANGYRRGGYNEPFQFSGGKWLIPELWMGKKPTIKKMTYGIQDNRNHGINFESVEKHGSIEFRYWEGNTNPEVIIALIKMCRAFIDKTKRDGIIAFPKKVKFGKRIPGLNANMLRRDFLTLLNLDEKTKRILLNKANGRDVKFSKLIYDGW